MITENEIISDLKGLMAKVELMALTYKNNDTWKKVNSMLDSILSEIQKDRRMYGY